MAQVRDDRGTIVAERCGRVRKTHAMLDEVAAPFRRSHSNDRPPHSKTSTTHPLQYGVDWRERDRTDDGFTGTHLSYPREVTVAPRRLATPSSVNAAIKQIADVMRACSRQRAPA